MMKTAAALLFACLILGTSLAQVPARAPGFMAPGVSTPAQHTPTADQAAEWTSLIGEGLDGWTIDKPDLAGHWENVDGVIVGKNPDKKGSILWTDANDFADFELIVEYRTPSADYDSGIFVRAESHQVQIGVSRSLKRDMTASIYAPKDGDGGYPAETDEEAIAEKHKLGDWNTLRIVVRGSNIQTFLNDAEICDYPTKTMPESGKIGLQLHGNVDMEMHFRAVKFRPLEDE